VWVWVGTRGNLTTLTSARGSREKWRAAAGRHWQEGMQLTGTEQADLGQSSQIRRRAHRAQSCEKPPVIPCQLLGIVPANRQTGRWASGCRHAGWQAGRLAGGQTGGQTGRCRRGVKAEEPALLLGGKAVALSLCVRACVPHHSGAAQVWPAGTVAYLSGGSLSVP